jgi:hypothetical protein
MGDRQSAGVVITLGAPGLAAMYAELERAAGERRGRLAMRLDTVVLDPPFVLVDAREAATLAPWQAASASCSPNAQDHASKLVAAWLSTPVDGRLRAMVCEAGFSAGQLLSGAVAVRAVRQAWAGLPEGPAIGVLTEIPELGERYVSPLSDAQLDTLARATATAFVRAQADHRFMFANVQDPPPLLPRRRATRVRDRRPSHPGQGD